MKTITIMLVWLSIQRDLASNTWKQGYLNPREDGHEGETQMSEDEPMDVHIAKRNTLDAISELLEIVKRWEPDAGTLPIDPSGITDTTTWLIDLNVTNRCDATGEQVSLLGHQYVVAYVVAEWYRLINADTAAVWMTRRDTAANKLVSALYHKKAPALS